MNLEEIRREQARTNDNVGALANSIVSMRREFERAYAPYSARPGEPEIQRFGAGCVRRAGNVAAAVVTDQLARVPADDVEIALDLSDAPWQPIFQDIVRRSETLRYLTAVTSFTCSKMRPDGFGGMAVLITADAVMGKSTGDIIEDFLAEAGLDAERRDGSQGKVRERPAAG